MGRAPRKIYWTDWSLALWPMGAAMSANICMRDGLSGGTDICTKPVQVSGPPHCIERVKQQAPEGFERNVDYLMSLSNSAVKRWFLFGFVQARKPYLSRGAQAQGYEHYTVME